MINIKKSLLLILAMFIFASFAQEKENTNNSVLKLTSNPIGAEVFLEGEKIGTTPFKKEINPGTKIIKLVKVDYKPKWVQVNLIAGEEKKYEINLSPITASVIIKSKPSGAEVVLNGELKGETPLVLKNLPIGRYSASIKREGFVAKQLDFFVKNKRPMIFTKNLSSNVGELAIISSPVGCRVEVNGLPKGITPYKEELEQGEYDVKLTKVGFATYTHRVMVDRGKTNTINPALEELPGILKVTTNPENVALFLNEKKYNNTPATIKNLPAGKYTLRLERKKFEAAYKDVTIYPGQTTDINIDLQTSTGGIELVVAPPGVSIKINGKDRGIAEPDPKNSKISKVFKLKDLPEGSYTVDLYHKRGVPDRIRKIIEVKKGKISRPLPIEMWISDHYLHLYDGTIKEGRLKRVSPTTIHFDIGGGITQEYQKEEVKELEKLEITE